LNTPDALSRSVEGLLKIEDIRRRETAGEVAGRGGVWQPLGVEGVEEVFILTPQLEVLKTDSAGEDVTGDTEDVVALVIGQMDLEKMKTLVDILNETNVLGHEVNGPDAPRRDSTDTVRDLVLDIAAFQDGLGLGGSLLGIQATGDAAFALAEDLLNVLLLHLKRAFEINWMNHSTLTSINADELFAISIPDHVTESRLLEG
jgi:hypothetical protein